MEPRLVPLSHQYSPIDLPLENVLVVEEPSIIEISDDEDDSNPESCGGNESFINIHVLEAFCAGDSFLSWIVDSGKTNHVCTSLHVLESWEELKGDKLQLRVGNGESVTAKALGIVRILFEINI